MSPLDQALIDLMLDEITLEHKTGVTDDNDFTYGQPQTLRCQVVRSAKRALDRAGREVTSRVQVILADPTVRVELDDRITLPNGDKPPIVQVNAASDETGPYYEEIMA